MRHVLEDRIEDLEATDVGKLEGIPGLRVNGLTGVALGQVDAIAAGAFRLGAKVPQFAIKCGLDILPPDLRAYQVAGIRSIDARLRAYGGALLADDMGLGKTRQAIEVVKLLATGRVLIVCPAAARETWRQEFLKWKVPSVFVIDTVMTKAKWVTASKARMVVCSYDHRVIDRTIEVAFGDEMPQMLLLDEAHRLRGRNSSRSKKLQQVAVMCDYKLALTGTPQYNRPRDLWQLLHILLGYRFGRKWDFDIAYCGGKPGQWGGMDNKGVTNAEELRLRLSYYMLRRETADVAKELPPLTRQVRWVDVTPDAKRAFHSAQLGLSKKGWHAALMSTLQGKFVEACDLAVDAKRFLLVTWTKQHAREFVRVLNNELDTRCALISGDLNHKARTALIEDARAQGYGLVATIDSVAESLNMQGVANVGIVHAIDPVALKMAQLEKRLHRLGSVSPVIWYYLAMKESSDTVLVKMVVDKLDQWKATMGGKSNKDMRHALGDHVDGAGAAATERAMLKSIYAAMKEGD